MTKYYALALSISYPFGAAASQLGMVVFGL